MKILYILNKTNRVNNFSYASMKAAQALGWEFHIAGNWSYSSDKARQEDEKKYGIKIYQVDFIRTPYAFGNIKAYKHITRIMKREQFDIVHCNTPIGGAIGRIAAKKNKIDKVIYQAHGFHFYKGAPLINWLVYYPIEKILARITDTIVTINLEDYKFAKRKMKTRIKGNVKYVPGVGINLEEYTQAQLSKIEIKRRLNIPDNANVLISVGELNINKNIGIVLDAMSKLKNMDLFYLICGIGPMKKELQMKSQNYGLGDRVKFLGYCDNIQEMLNASDVFLLPSYREGLSRSVMEAMANGLPCIVSNIRGNVDLIDRKGGFLCKPDNVDDFVNAIITLIDDDKNHKMGEYNKKKIQQFDSRKIIQIMQNIYRNYEKK